MSLPKNLISLKFSRLTVLSRLPNRGHESDWLCKCECGSITSAKGHSLTSGRKKSCGCLIAEARVRVLTTHGLSKTREYAAHTTMMSRCYDPRNGSFERYGAVGVKVHPDWHDCVKFCADMGVCPEGYTLDRKDNSKGYEPGNCRWATVEEQANHKKNNVYVIVSGQKFSVAQASRAFKVQAPTLAWRLRNKKDFSDLIPGGAAA